MVFFKIAKIPVERKILFLMLLLSFLSGIYKLSFADLYYDELGLLTASRGFLQEGISGWEYSMAQPPPFAVWITAIFFYFFGVNIFVLRLVEVVFGIGMLLAAYHLARIWYDKRVAILAIVLLSLSPLHITSMRIAYIDTMVTFFTLLAIFFSEYVFVKKLIGRKRILFLIFSGFFLGIAFLTKMNSLILWAIYLIVRFVVFVRNKQSFKSYIYFFTICNIIAFLTLMAFTRFKPSNIFYLAYGLFYMLMAHKSLGYNPFYYPYIILIKALSPVIFVLFLVSIIYFIKKSLQKKNKIDLILLLSIIIFFFLAGIQKRIASRHLVLILPFLVIMASNFLVDAANFQFFKNKKYAIACVLLISVLSSIFYSMKEVSEEINYSVWDDVSNFINSKIEDNATIYSIFPYWPLAHRMTNYTYYTYNINKTIIMRPNLPLAKTADYFVLGNFSGTFDLVRHEPITGDINILGYKIHKRVMVNPYPKTSDFVKRNGKLIKEFKCDVEACIYLYKLENASSESLKNFAEEEWDIYPDQSSKKKFFDFVCGQWNENNMFRDIISFAKSERILRGIERKCRSEKTN